MPGVKGQMPGQGEWDAQAFGAIVYRRWGEGQRKWGYADAAAVLNVDVTTVKRWATKGLSSPPRKDHDDIAARLGVPVAALHGDVNALNRALNPPPPLAPAEGSDSINVALERQIEEIAARVVARIEPQLRELRIRVANLEGNGKGSAGRRPYRHLKLIK